MGTDVQIIEFVGLPASGKSTIANSLKEKLSVDYKVAVWTDITQAFKHSGIKKMIGSIPFNLLIDYFRLFLTLPKTKSRKWYMYWFAIKISLLYRYCKKYSAFDYILIDHGILQHMVSILCGETPDKAFIKRLERILDREKSVDMYIECIVDLSIARSRMELRGRKEEGRLDRITNSTIRSEMYKKEKANFNLILRTASEIENGWVHATVNTNLPIDTVIAEVEGYLCREGSKA